MDKSNIDTNTYWLLTKLTMRSKHEFIKLAEAYGITPFQLFTLYSLEPDRSVPTGSLARVLLCDTSYVTGTVERLVQDGYLSRQEDPEDRRVRNVLLTKKGIHLRKKILGVMQTLEKQTFAALTLEESAQLHILLKKVLESPNVYKEI